MAPRPRPSDGHDDHDDLVVPIGGSISDGHPTRDALVDLVLGAALAAASWAYGQPWGAAVALAAGIAWARVVVTVARGRHVVDGTRLSTRHGITRRVTPRAGWAGRPVAPAPGWRTCTVRWRSRACRWLTVVARGLGVVPGAARRRVDAGRGRGLPHGPP